MKKSGGYFRLGRNSQLLRRSPSQSLISIPAPGWSAIMNYFIERKLILFGMYPTPKDQYVSTRIIQDEYDLQVRRHLLFISGYFPITWKNEYLALFHNP